MPAYYSPCYIIYYVHIVHSSNITLMLLCCTVTTVRQHTNGNRSYLSCICRSDRVEFIECICEDMLSYFLLLNIDVTLLPPLCSWNIQINSHTKNSTKGLYLWYNIQILL